MRICDIIESIDSFQLEQVPGPALFVSMLTMFTDPKTAKKNMTENVKDYLGPEAHQVSVDAKYDGDPEDQEVVVSYSGPAGILMRYLELYEGILYDVFGMDEIAERIRGKSRDFYYLTNINGNRPTAYVTSEYDEGLLKFVKDDRITSMKLMDPKSKNPNYPMILKGLSIINEHIVNGDHDMITIKRELIAAGLKHFAKP